MFVAFPVKRFIIINLYRRDTAIFFDITHKRSIVDRGRQAWDNKF